MDAMLANPVAPIVPVTSAPVHEAHAPHEDSTSPAGFDQALKHELNALKPEERTKESDAEKDADSATPQTLDSTVIPLASEAAIVQAYAAPIPVAQSFVTLPTDEVLTPDAPVEETSEAPAVVSAELAADPSVIASRASDAIGATQSIPQLPAAQQSVRDLRGGLQGATQSNAGQSNAVK